MDRVLVKVLPGAVQQLHLVRQVPAEGLADEGVQAVQVVDAAGDLFQLFRAAVVVPVGQKPHRAYSIRESV